MNLLEHHIQQCRACEPLEFRLAPFPCRRRRVLEGFILESFLMDGYGRVFSVLEEWGRPVRVEIGTAYCMVLALLRGVSDSRCAMDNHRPCHM